MSAIDEFDVLPAPFKRRIDNAFDIVIRQTQADNADQDNDNEETPAGRVMATDELGGFIVDNAEKGGFIPDEPGGFVVDEPGGFIPDGVQNSYVIPPTSSPAPTPSSSKLHTKSTHIPLSLISSALALLSLPDDEQVMEVFRNAASGWASVTGSTEERLGEDRGGRGDGAVGREEAVSRDDWRAVCAVLLGQSIEDEDNGGDGMEVDLERVDDDDESDLTDFEDEGENEEYSAGSDDDFLPSKSKTAKSKSKSKLKSKRSVNVDSSSPSRALTPSKRATVTPSQTELTSRQKSFVLLTFSLFFPNASTSDGELEKKRIGMKDVQRIAKLLKEKIGADEIKEMLSEFSTAPDKSMGLDDFGRMMVEAGLV